MKKPRWNWKTIVEAFLFFSLVLSVIYIIFNMVMAPSDHTIAEEHSKVKTDYVLMLLSCLGGLIIMMIPRFIEKKKKIDIPDVIEIIYFLFLYCAIYLGEVRNFYYLIPFWDVILHAFSGMMLGALGFILVRFLNDSSFTPIQLSPFFVSFFAFCFAVTSGVLWEVYEFTVDGLFSTNMQKFITSDNTVLVGREALMDTMSDLIVDSVSTLIICGIGYLQLYRWKKYLKV